jgi:hypothetical protein
MVELGYRNEKTVHQSLGLAPYLKQEAIVLESLILAQNTITTDGTSSGDPVYAPTMALCAWNGTDGWEFVKTSQTHGAGVLATDAYGIVGSYHTGAQVYVKDTSALASIHQGNGFVVSSELLKIFDDETTFDFIAIDSAVHVNLFEEGILNKFIKSDNENITYYYEIRG